MSTAVLSPFYEFDDAVHQNRTNGNSIRPVMGMEPRKITSSNHLITSQSQHFFQHQPPPQMQQQQQMQQRFQQQQTSQQQQHFQQLAQFRTRTGSMSSMNSDNSMSSGSPTHSSASSVISSVGSTPSSPVQDFRKLDRSVSEPVTDQSYHYRTLSPKDMNTAKQDMVNNKANQGNINASRYKTELCRPFEEHGYCKYGDKCQFAHGTQELRSLNRHPKYKTELCRTYHTIGFCPYGPRCHFIHNDEERRQQQAAAALQGLKMQHPGSNPQSPVQGTNPSLQTMPHAPPPPMPQYPATGRPGNLPSRPQSLNQPPPAVISAPPQPHLRPKSLNFNNLMSMQRDSLGSTAESPPSSDTDSPPTLSPTFFGEEMIMGGTFSQVPPVSAPAALQQRTYQQQHLGSSAFPFHDLGVMPVVPEASLLTPLNVQTEQELGMASLAAQLQALNLANQRNNNVNCNDVLALDFLGMLVPPPRSPESDSSSSSSEGSDTCGSPPEVSRSLRLPIFSKLSNSDDSD